MPSDGNDNDKPSRVVSPMVSDDDVGARNNVNDNISNTINNENGSNLTAVKTEIKLEMEALDLNRDPTGSKDNIPLDQLVSSNKPNDDFDADGNGTPSGGNVSAVVEEPMAVDDPELFGPFTKSQLTANIQSETDQMFYNSFQDQITLLETAIGSFSDIF